MTEWGKLANDNDRLRARIAELERQLDAAKEDTSRLDWLDTDGPTSHDEWDDFQFYFASAHKTIREAIDAARK